MLEEKQVPYIIEKINMRCYGDKPDEFMRKVCVCELKILTTSLAFASCLTTSSDVCLSVSGHVASYSLSGSM